MQIYNQTMKSDLARGLACLTGTCNCSFSLVGYLTILSVSRLYSIHAVLNMLQIIIFVVLKNLLLKYQLCLHKFITHDLKICTFISVTVDLYTCLCFINNVHVYLWFVCSIFHTPSSSVTLVIIIKPKVKSTFHAAAILLFYLLQKYYLLAYLQNNYYCV